MKPGRIIGFVLLGGLLGTGLGAAYWLHKNLAPTPVTASQYFHLDRPEKLGVTLKRLAALGVVRDPGAMSIEAWIQRQPRTVRQGTYLIQGGLSPDEIFAAITHEIHQKFRFPETNWARRDANLLQKADVCSAKDYLALVAAPDQFAGTVDFQLPTRNLEGYLYPDTYDLPPLTPARSVVERQLRAFENKVVARVGAAAITEPVLCKASLVELETGTDADRAIIAGVIDNRLKKGMALQIDAGIEYALGKWRRLYFKDYKNVKSPYNLYLHKGLPPTPICSPSLKSILAVLHPAKHAYLYYVALPNGHSIFARTPSEHEHNIKIRRQELAKQKAARDLLNSLAKSDPAVPDASGPDKPSSVKN